MTDTQSVITNIVSNAFNFQLNAQQRFSNTQRLAADGSFAGVPGSLPIVDPVVVYIPGETLSISVGDLGLTPDTEQLIFREIAENLPYDLIIQDVI